MIDALIILLGLVIIWTMWIITPKNNKYELEQKEFEIIKLRKEVTELEGQIGEMKRNGSIK